MEDKKAASDMAASLLRDAILSGELKPRQRLIETELSEQFNMSRTPVREAIKRLVPLGLVVVEPYKGASVADIDAQHIRDIYEVRVTLESQASVQAAGRIPEEELNRLACILDEMETLNRREGRIRLQELNEEFHASIYAHCGNKVLLHMINELLEQSALFRRTAMESEKNVARINRDHRELLCALRAKDTKRIERVSYDHIKVFLSDSLYWA